MDKTTTAAIATVVAGGLVGMQAPINSILGKSVGTFAAASVSFAVGLAVLVAITLVAEGFGEVGNAGDLKWYYLTGGLLGAAIVNLLPLAPDEHIQAVIDTRDYPSDRYLFFATRKGTVKKTPFSEYDKSRREGFIAINLNEGDELVRVIQTTGGDDIFMVSRNGTTIRFSEDDVRPMGRSAAGVRGMRMKEGDEVVSCDVARDDAAILIVTDAGYGKRTQLDRFNRQTRGGQGVRGIKLTAKRGYVAAAFMVGLDDEIFGVSSGGVTIRMPVREISSQGRDATGVRVMNLDAGQTVAAVAPVLKLDDTDAE
jgi:DNA gyrase subunit A